MENQIEQPAIKRIKKRVMNVDSEIVTEPNTDTIKNVGEPIPKTLSFRTAFTIVFVLHLLGGLGIFGFGNSSSVKADDDKKFLNSKEAIYVGEDKKAEPEKKAEPVKKAEPEKRDDWPKAKIHVIRKGETITTIAKLHNVSHAKLMEINGIKNANLIIEGTKLKLP